MSARRRATTRIPGKAVGYIRVSTGRQVKEGFSLDAQRHRIQAYCAAKGWQLADIYEDAGISGTKRSRDGFDRMVEDVLADGVSHIVAVKLDRLGRSAKALLDVYDKLERKGVTIATIDDGIDTSTATGRLFRTILAGVAEFESERISERVKQGMAEAKSQGARFGKRSTIPKATLARIRKLRDKDGLSYGAIAARLNEDGVPVGQTGKQWYASSVRVTLLANPPKPPAGA